MVRIVGPHTCGNTVSVPKAPFEKSTLAILQHHLSSEERAQVFIDEFTRDTAQHARGEDRRDEAARLRLSQIKIEFANLYQNRLAGVDSMALRTIIDEREAEKNRLQGNIDSVSEPKVEFL